MRFRINFHCPTYPAALHTGSMQTTYIKAQEDLLVTVTSGHFY